MSPQTRPRVSHIGEIPQSLWECRTRKLDCHFQLLPLLLLPPLTHLPVSAPDKVQLLHTSPHHRQYSSELLHTLITGLQFLCTV